MKAILRKQQMKQAGRVKMKDPSLEEQLPKEDSNVDQLFKAMSEGMKFILRDVTEHNRRQMDFVQKYVMANEGKSGDLVSEATDKFKELLEIERAIQQKFVDSALKQHTKDSKELYEKLDNLVASFNMKKEDVYKESGSTTKVQSTEETNNLQEVLISEQTKLANKESTLDALKEVFDEETLEEKVERIKREEQQLDLLKQIAGNAQTNQQNQKQQEQPAGGTSFFGGMAAGLGKWLQRGLAFILGKSLTGLLTGAVTGLLTHVIKPLLGSLKGFAMKFITKLLPAAGSTLLGTMKHFLKLSGIGALIAGVGYLIYDTIKGMLSGESLYEALRGAVGNVLDFLTFGLINEDSLKKLESFAVDIWKEYLEGPVNSILSVVGDFYKSYIEPYIKPYLDMLDKFYVDNIKPSIDAIVDPVLKFFDNVATNIKSYLKEAGQFEIMGKKFDLFGAEEEKSKPLTGEVFAPFKGGLDAATHRQTMDAELHKAGITDPREIAAFKAQIDAETSGFKLLKEREYSPETVWKLRGKQLESMGVTKDQVQADYKANGSKSMFEYMYSDKYRKDGFKLGNNEAGDGEKYRGRGAFQLTGKSNYEAMSMKLFGDKRLVENPDLVETPEVSSKVAIQYWKDKGLGKHARAGDIDKVSAGVNAGNANANLSKVHGLDKRRKLYEKHRDELLQGKIVSERELAGLSAATPTIAASSVESSLDFGATESINRSPVASPTYNKALVMTNLTKEVERSKQPVKEPAGSLVMAPSTVNNQNTSISTNRHVARNDQRVRDLLTT